MDILTIVVVVFFLPSLVYTFKKVMSQDIRDSVNSEIKSVIDEVFDSFTPKQ